MCGIQNGELEQQAELLLRLDLELAEKEELVQALEQHLPREESLKGASLRDQLELVLRNLEHRNFELERQLKEKDEIIEQLEEDAEKRLFDLPTEGESENSDSWLIGPPTAYKKADQVKELESKVTELQRVNSELRRKVIVCEEMIGTLSEEKLEKEESIKILVEEIAQCEVGMMGLKENNLELRVSLDDATRQLEDLQLKGEKEWKQTVLQLRNEITSLRDELTSSKQTNSVLSAKLFDQSETTTRLLREKEQLLHEFNELHQTFNELKKTGDSLQREKLQLLQDLSLKKDRGEQVMELNNDFMELSEQNKLLRKQLNERQQAFLKSTAESDEERIRMKRDLDRLTRLLRDVSNTLDYSSYNVATSEHLVNEKKSGEPIHRTSELDSYFEEDAQTPSEAWGILDENDRLNQSVEAMLFYGGKDDQDNSYLTQNSTSKLQSENRSSFIDQEQISSFSNYKAAASEGDGLDELINAVNEKLRSVYQLLSSLKSSLDRVCYILVCITIRNLFHQRRLEKKRTL